MLLCVMLIRSCQKRNDIEIVGKRSICRRRQANRIYQGKNEWKHHSHICQWCWKRRIVWIYKCRKGNRTMFDCVGKGNNRFYMYKEYSICTDCETYNNSSEPGVWLKIYEILFGLPTNMVRGVKYTTIDGSNNKKNATAIAAITRTTSHCCQNRRAIHSVWQDRRGCVISL